MKRYTSTEQTAIYVAHRLPETNERNAMALRRWRSLRNRWLQQHDIETAAALPGTRPRSRA